MKKVRCSLSFHRSKVDELDIFAIAVRDGIYTNPAEFVTPPMTEVDFQKKIDTFINTRRAYKQGGSAQKRALFGRQKRSYECARPNSRLCR
jgi:hypothetical protein